MIITGDNTNSSEFKKKTNYKLSPIIDPGNDDNGNDTTYTDEVPALLTHCGYSIKTLITILSCVSVLLVWWYTELERRLLVIRHHLCGELNLLFTPLARNQNLKFTKPTDPY